MCACSALKAKAECMARYSALTCLQASRWVRLPSQAPVFGQDTTVVELGLECQRCAGGMKASEPKHRAPDGQGSQLVLCGLSESVTQTLQLSLESVVT